MAISHATVSIRPKVSTAPVRSRNRLAASACYGASTLMWFLHNHGVTRLVTAAASIVVLAGLWVYARRWKAGAFVSVKGETLTYRGFFAHDVPVASVARVVKASVRWSGSTQTERLIVLDDRDHALLAFEARPWAEGDLDDVVRALGVSLEIEAELCRARDLRRRYPRSTNWVLARPIAATFVLLGAVSGAVLIADALTGNYPS